jgi:hypothetical protein
MTTKIDMAGKTVKVDPITSIVRVDGVILCKRIIRSGVTYLQFKDGDRLRSNCRGTQFIEVPLDAFEKVLLAALVDEVNKMV